MPLKLRGRNRALVGLGSYIVNAQGGCNDCHTNPPYAPGGDPFQGEPEQINTAGTWRAGAVRARSSRANITPDEDGQPAGHDLPGVQRRCAPATTRRPDRALLQVMPWPVFGNMTDHDLQAVYEYLRSIPSSTRRGRLGKNLAPCPPLPFSFHPPPGEGGLCRSSRMRHSADPPPPPVGKTLYFTTLERTWEQPPSYNRDYFGPGLSQIIETVSQQGAGSKEKGDDLVCWGAGRSPPSVWTLPTRKPAAASTMEEYT